MRLLLLCGVDDSGKSTTIRQSTKHLGLAPERVEKFLKPGNPPKRVTIEGIPVYIYCASPQELSESNTYACKKSFIGRIEGKEPNALVIMPFNLERKYEQGVNACLDEIDRRNLKGSSFFVQLDATLRRLAETNREANLKVQEMRERGYSFVGIIRRTENITKEQRGERFSTFIWQQIRAIQREDS